MKNLVYFRVKGGSKVMNYTLEIEIDEVVGQLAYKLQNKDVNAVRLMDRTFSPAEVSRMPIGIFKVLMASIGEAKKEEFYKFIDSEFTVGFLNRGGFWKIARAMGKDPTKSEGYQAATEKFNARKARKKERDDKSHKEQNENTKNYNYREAYRENKRKGFDEDYIRRSREARRDRDRKSWEQERKTWEDYQNPFTGFNDPYAILGVTRGADQNALRRAFKKLVLLYHPDTTKLPSDEAKRKFDEVVKAYDRIRA